jgi:Ca2+-binding EF-hand superfamily protein
MQMNSLKKVTAVTLSSALALGLVGSALAQDAEQGGMRGGKGGPDLAAMFEMLDADNDGKVTQAEIDAHRAARVAEVDANKDGLLSAEELAQMQIKAATARATEMAAKMVQRLDTDGDKLLSAAELMAGPGPESMLDRIDMDGDGAVSLAEIEAAKEKMDEHGGRGLGDKGHHGGRGGFWGMFGGGEDQ